MTEMIERVAKALYEREKSLGMQFSGASEHFAWDGPNFKGQQAFREMARVAIEALRDVTPDVWDAMAASLYGHSRDKAVEFAKEDKYEIDGYRAEDVWKAGIDAALAATAQPTPAVME